MSLLVALVVYLLITWLSCLLLGIPSSARHPVAAHTRSMRDPQILKNRAFTLFPSIALCPGEGLAQNVCRTDLNGADGLQSVFSSLKREGKEAPNLRHCPGRSL